MYSVRREEGANAIFFFGKIYSLIRTSMREKARKQTYLKVRLGLSANKTWEKACKCTLF